MGNHVYAVAAAALIKLDFIGMQNCRNHDLMRNASLYHDRTVRIIDRNHRSLADFEVQLLANLPRAEGQSGERQYRHCFWSPANSNHVGSPTATTAGCCGLQPSRKASASVRKH